LASKRYRDKKKGMVNQLQQQMDAMSEQLKKIEQDKQDAIKTVERLKAENETLRNKNHKQAEQYKRTHDVLLLQMDQMIKRNATDEELRPILKSFFEMCAGVVKLSGCHFNLMLNPSMVHQLTKTGFFSDTDIQNTQSQSANSTFVN